MRENRLVQMLEAAQREYAEAALKQPTERDAFAYGRACGFVQGLEQARDIILNAYAAEEEEGKFL